MADFESWLANNKALWARVYDEVIVPDLEKEWKKRTDAREADLNNKDERLQILNNHVSNGVIEKAQLVEENTRLRNLLQKTRGNTPSAEELIINTDDATISITEYRQVTKKLDELNKQYQDAVLRIKYLERKNVAVMQKNKEMKDSVKAWQEYCDRNIEKKRMKTGSKVTKVQPRSNLVIETPGPEPSAPSSPGSAALRTPRPLFPQECSSPAPMVDLSSAINRLHTPYTTGIGGVGHGNGADADLAHEDHEGAASERRSSPPLPTEDGRAEATSSSNHDRTALLGQFSSDKVTSSQTTVPEVMEQDHETTPRVADPVDDDDEPEFVSERSLKRKRKPSTGLRIFHDGSSDGTPVKPVRIKEELNSSPPPESTVNQLQRKETMDLDELGPNPIITPRHRRVRRVNYVQPTETGTLRNQRSSSAPFSGNLIKPEPIEEGHTADSRPDSHLAVETGDTRAVSEPGDATMGSRDILQPLDPNILTNRASEVTPNKRVRREEARKEAGFNILAESGETPPPTNERKKRLPPNLARAHFNERIRAAKSGLSPMKNALTTPKTAPARTNAAQLPTPPSTAHQPVYTPSERPAQRKASAAAPVPRPELVPDGRPIWRMGALEPTRKAPTPPAPKDDDPPTRLRDKPVTELRIQDFKPNPAYNQGYTHAFAETVRRREDRLCLPGCTNPACCGSTFRTLASAAAPLPASQEEALLQDYLGDAYDSFGLTQMDKGERDEIVLQARTRKMATEHGKHRKAYEGRKTPPGFWRVDFPNTQEQEQDREMAAKMQQAEVRERYLQAMRRGGKFVFADE